MAYHNIHTHIFTMNNAPRKFLNLYMPEFAADTIDSITSTRAGAWATKVVLNNLGGSAGKKYASFLSVGKSAGQLDVFRELLEQYEDSSMKLTALTLYMEKLGAEASLSGFEGQIEEIITVKKRYPDRLLIFFSIDPRWKTTGDQIQNTLKTYFENKIHIDATRNDIFPFTGIKLYPSTGFYAFDEKLKPSLEWAADNHMPILTHCNYLGGIFNNDRDKLNTSLSPKDPYSGVYYPAPGKNHKLQSKFFNRLFNTQKAVNNKYYSSYFLEPNSYRSTLEYFRDVFKKPLKICFAHYGGNEHMNLQHAIDQGKKMDPGNYYGVNSSKNWCLQIRELMEEFDSVYTDISYALTDHNTHEFIFSEMLNKPYRDRILFGTDFYMTERKAKEKDTYTKFKKEALNRPITAKNGTVTNVWEMMAGSNVEDFLDSTFYEKGS